MLVNMQGVSAMSPDDCRKILSDTNSVNDQKKWMDCLFSENYGQPKIPEELEKDAKLAENLRQKIEDSKLIISKEIKSPLTSFEVRELNIGQDSIEALVNKFVLSKDIESVDGYPDVKKFTISDGTVLIFYRDILFMVLFNDLQDPLEVKAVMNQLETKFKSKFTGLNKKITQKGNIEKTVEGFSMNVSTYGTIRIEFGTSKPILKKVCIDDIAREMRMNIEFGRKNYLSLTDRVENECAIKDDPIGIIVVNKMIEAVVNSRATDEQRNKKKKEDSEKINSAIEKAKRF
jgi:hypothetical protein